MRHEERERRKSTFGILEIIGIPMSESTIFALLRQNKIPHQRPSPRILVFNLDKIDEWLGIK